MAAVFGSAFTIRRTSKPSIPGNKMSRSIRSGLSFFRSSMAASPVGTDFSLNFFDSLRPRSPERSTSSSTMSTLFCGTAGSSMTIIVSLFFRLDSGKCDGRRRAVSFMRSDRYRASMPLYDGFGNIEAKTRPVGRHVRSIGASKKSLKKPGLVRRRDANAGIMNGERHGALRFRDSHGNFPAVLRILDGVVDEVFDRECELTAVIRYGRYRSRFAKCEADVFGTCRFFQEADGDPDRIAHIAGFDIKLEGAVRYARNVQEVVGDRHHVVGCARALFCNLALLGPKR